MYQPKVYKKQGGDELVVANGGKLTVEPGGFFMGGNPTGAADYFVDLNVSATGDGSMASPFSTIAEAIAASNTSIGLTANRWWARRNRIFVMGDGISEDLTVLPEKCDIIGVGSDLYPFPRVIGHHIIATAKVGFRSINMGWQNDASSDLFVLKAGSHGTQFIGGIMTPAVGGSTKALECTDSACIIIDGVRIQYNIGGGIFAEGITFEGTVGHEITVKGCDIYATEGIHVASGNGCTGSIIKDNDIYATAKTINDESLLFRVTGNRLISAATVGVAAAAGGIVCNPLLASGNKIGGKDTVTNADYPFVIQLTS